MQAKQIFNKVSIALDVPGEKIKSKERWQWICDARHIYCYLSIGLTNEKLVPIAREINRGHWDVIRSRKIAMELIETDNEKFIEKLKIVIRAIDENLLFT